MNQEHLRIQKQKLKPFKNLRIPLQLLKPTAEYQPNEEAYCRATPCC